MYRSLTPVERDLLARSEELWSARLPALRTARQHAGGLLWKTVSGHDYLVRHWNDRVTGKKQSNSLGPRSRKTEAVYERFQRDRARAVEVLESSEDELEILSNLGRASRLERLGPVVTSVLRGLAVAGLADAMPLFSPHAAFAYGASFGCLYDIGPDTGSLDLYLLLNDFDPVQDGLAAAIAASARGAVYEAGRFVVERAAGTLNIVPFTPDMLLAAIRRSPDWTDEKEEVVVFGFESITTAATWIGDDGGPVPVVAIHPRGFVAANILLGGDRARLARDLLVSSPSVFGPDHRAAFPDLDDEWDEGGQRLMP